MNEWLTTGEMIDRLKVGEVAEVIDSKEGLGAEIIGDIVTFNGLDFRWKDNQRFHLNNYSKHLEWRILPKYVSFEEAMKALSNEKRVRVELSNPDELFEYELTGDEFYYRNIKRGDKIMYRPSDTSHIGIHGVFISRGKWSIEEDSHES